MSLTATLAVVIAMAETGEEATVAAALVEEGQETGVPELWRPQLC